MPSAISAAKLRVSDRVGWGMDGEREVGGVGPHLDREGGFRDELSRVRADDSRAEEAVAVRVEDELGQSFAAAHAERPSARRPREGRGLHRESLLFRLPLARSRPRHLGVGVGDGGHRPGIEARFPSGRHFRRDLALVGGLVCQHGLAG